MRVEGRGRGCKTTDLQGERSTRVIDIVGVLVIRVCLVSGSLQ